MIGLGRRRKFEAELNEVESLIKRINESASLKEDLIQLLYSLDNLEVIREVGEETPYYPFLITEYSVTSNDYEMFRLSVTLGGEVELIDLNEKLVG